MTSTPVWRRATTPLPMIPREYPRKVEIEKLSDVLDGFERQPRRVILPDDYGNDDEKRGA